MECASVKMMPTEPMVTGNRLHLNLGKRVSFGSFPNSLLMSYMSLFYAFYNPHRVYTANC